MTQSTLDRVGLEFEDTGRPRGEPSPAPQGFRVLHINGDVVIRPETSAWPSEGRPLTDRERQVLALVAEGHSNKAIASELVISERTVKNHLTYIMTKLRAMDRTHAVVTAVRLGALAI